ncbi:nucleobase:cation symporter-2 family protein [Sporosarcina sp. FSL K6-1522]|uniref:nucleobase:cation symporter-2 family protein n=1 Tax=Sporosarcina sp. FSL K6-1522 TaxID=2921554 RepID=UPI00315B0432
MDKLSKISILMLGFQHVCVMYGGAVAVPLIVGPAIGLTQEQIVYLISFDLLACGVVTLLQVVGGKGFGIRLPALMAVSFIVVEPVIAIGQAHSITGVMGAVMVSGLIVGLLSKYIGKLVPFFPPLVAGSVILIIGVSLMPVAMKNAAGGGGAASFGDPMNLFLAAFTLLTFVILNTLTKGFMKAISILLSMVMGTIVAAFLGMVDASAFTNASWFTMVKPFYFGVPTFDASSIITMTIISLIIAIESIGVFLTLGDVCDREIDAKEVEKGLRAEGFGSFISGVFNSFNHSTFSQNVGLVLLTKVTQRSVVIMAGCILVVLGFVPKVAGLTTMIPFPVLGGAMIPMFGMLLTAALGMIAKADLSKPTNQLTIAIGIGVGLAIKGVPEAFAQFPETLQLICGNGVVMGSFTLVLLNAILNGKSDPKVVHHHSPSPQEKLDMNFVEEGPSAVQNIHVNT